jgi:hypothetical protein
MATNKLPSQTSMTTNHHVDYMDLTQHWHPESEPFAGGDALVTLLEKGWEMQREIQVEKREFAGLRSVSVYHVMLKRGEETIRVPVVRNPYINRVLRTGDFEQIPMQKS